MYQIKLFALIVQQIIMFIMDIVNLTVQILVIASGALKTPRIMKFVQLVN